MTRIRPEEGTRVPSVVVSVSSSPGHGFSKSLRGKVRLLADQAVEGDAHAGTLAKHRFIARWRPTTPNERQVHLIDAELFDELAREGFRVGPGDLGENITTRGLDLCRLPLGARLRLGARAVVQ